MIGRKSRQALEERLEREALGTPKRRTLTRDSLKSRRRAPGGRYEARRTETFATCQACGAMRIPDPQSGKLPPHRCEA